MDIPNSDWQFEGIVIRNRPTTRMVAVTDLWKAAGSPTPLRPDKWFKSDFVQEKLERLASILESGIERDDKDKIVGVPGSLEIVRGGRYNQGTFISYDLAIEYTELVSEKFNKWFISVLPESASAINNVPNSSIVLTFPIGADDFPGEVRITPDGRVSIYDGIGYLLGTKNPRQVWNELEERFPEVVRKTDNFQFPGQGQRETPVATLEVFVEILVTLPGRVAAQVREKAVRTLIRAMKGDLTLVEEILDRIHNPQDLIDLENMVQFRRQKAYGSELPSGTLNNPLDKEHITPQIKSGYGWKDKTNEMTDLLVQLATHVGDMIIDRDLPHRPYGNGTSKAKSRIIPLMLRTLKSKDILHVYHFQCDYIDDENVVDIFKSRAYPEIAYRDFKDKGIKVVVTHLVAPGGVTKAAAERLKECQSDLDAKFNGAIKLDAMRLDELVWGEMYPAIEERYRDTSGKIGQHHFNRKITTICKKLCDKTPGIKALKSRSKSIPVNENQLSLFSELLFSS